MFTTVVFIAVLWLYGFAVGWITYAWLDARANLGF